MTNLLLAVNVYCLPAVKNPHLTVTAGCIWALHTSTPMVVLQKCVDTRCLMPGNLLLSCMARTDAIIYFKSTQQCCDTAVCMRVTCKQTNTNNISYHFPCSLTQSSSCSSSDTDLKQIQNCHHSAQVTSSVNYISTHSTTKQLHKYYAQTSACTISHCNIRPSW